MFDALSLEQECFVNFSVNRIINVEGTKEIGVELEFKQYNFNETLSFPFNVPKNYKRN